MCSKTSNRKSWQPPFLLVTRDSGSRLAPPSDWTQVAARFGRVKCTMVDAGWWWLTIVNRDGPNWWIMVDGGWKCWWWLIISILFKRGYPHIAKSPFHVLWRVENPRYNRLESVELLGVGSGVNCSEYRLVDVFWENQLPTGQQSTANYSWINGESSTGNTRN